MKTKVQTSVKQPGGFTLVEMIGVLAIIAILTSLLIPKIFQVINDAKISNAVVAYNSVKTGAAAHYGKWGGFRNADGNTYDSYPVGDWDQVLIKGGYLETPFAVKIGNGLQGDNDGDGEVDANSDGSFVRLIDISDLDEDGGIVSAGDEDNSGTYSLSAEKKPTESSNEIAFKIDVTGSVLVEAVIPGVSLEDARELNRRIDGSADGFGDLTWSSGNDVVTADYGGRCKWKLEDGGTVTVYLYVAHR